LLTRITSVATDAASPSIWRTIGVTDRRLISVIVIAAVIRVLFFAAAFPLFNNLDEVSHIDHVIKVQTGAIRLDDAYEPATRDLIFLYGYGTSLGAGGRELRLYRSPEYMEPRPVTDEVPIPVWMAPATVQSAIEPTAKEVWLTRRNHEAGEPPLYYALAAAWARLGQRLGFTQARLLYWVRGMGAVIVGLLVVLAAAFGRAYDPTSRALCVGVPLLVAAFPQKVFYSITNDVLSPLVGGLAVYCGLRLLVREELGGRHALLVGALIAFAILTKLTNVLLIAMIPVLVVFRARRVRPKAASLLAGWLILGMTAPLVVWRLWAGASAYRAGDKAAAFGWTYRSLAELVEHPIFTVSGAWYFVSQLMMTFWRGELRWHGEPLALFAMDATYVALSLALLGAAGARLFRERRAAPRRAALLSVVVVVASVLLLAGLSMMFNFGGFFYPSRELPFFVSGRLIAAALLPFAALIIYGLEGLVARTRLGGHELVMILDLAVIITVVELVLAFDVIASPFNWFHLG
jgi:4-amino-4-deoxy-L-arabinose transferase-like glycosyltransferase